MADEKIQEIYDRLSEKIDEAMTRVHSAKNAEVSNLLGDVHKRLGKIENVLAYELPALKKDVEKLQTVFDEKIVPKIPAWDSSSENQKWVTRLVMGAVVLALLAVIGLK